MPELTRFLTMATVVGAAVVATIACGAGCARPVSAATAGERADLPVRLVIVDADPEQPVEESRQDDERRWGRADVTRDSGRWPPIRSDWSDSPAGWELRALADVVEIPQAVRFELAQLDCAIPRYRYATAETSVIQGEFERPGQRDLAVLCVHSDKTSSTYVFWGSEASRRETMPLSGSSLSSVERADVESRLDLTKPIEPDMPGAVTHDGIDIGCCECCSTIFFRHNGRWFTLLGAD